MALEISNTEKLSIPEDSLVYDNLNLRKNIYPTDITLYSTMKEDMSFMDVENDDINNKNKLTFAGHYYIRKTGEIFKGRPENVIGEFAYGNGGSDGKVANLNYNNIGVCLEGDFSKNFLTDGQVSSLIALCNDIRDRHTPRMNLRFLNEFNYGYNPGVLFSFTEVYALFYKTYPLDKTLIGPIKFYTFGKREFWLDTVTPFKGTDVYALQIILSYLGIYEIEPSGTYDSYTQSCIEKYQTLNNLVDSGIAGFRTIHKIINDMKALNAPKIYKRVLEIEEGEEHQTGSDVFNVQKALNTKFFKCRISGEYDPDTASQVSRFQEANGVTPDGKVGPITWNLLFSNSSTENFRTIKFDSSNIMYGIDIKTLQEKLVELGYIMPITEKYDYITEANVRRFQIHHDLPPSGVVDKDLWDLIFK